ncbi:hypothetical protein SLA2020_200420 [Shorea laevis]
MDPITFIKLSHMWDVLLIDKNKKFIPLEEALTLVMDKKPQSIKDWTLETLQSCWLKPILVMRGDGQKATIDQGLDIKDSPKLLAQAYFGNERSGSHPLPSSSIRQRFHYLKTPVSRLMHHSEGSLDITSRNDKMG